MTQQHNNTITQQHNNTTPFWSTVDVSAAVQPRCWLHHKWPWTWTILATSYIDMYKHRDCVFRISNPPWKPLPCTCQGVVSITLYQHALPGSVGCLFFDASSVILLLRYTSMTFFLSRVSIPFLFAREIFLMIDIYIYLYLFRVRKQRV